MTGPTEAVVVRLPERFEDFYEREYHRVVGFAYAIAGSWEAAEDAAQEAFLRAHHRWGQVGRYDQPGAWVRRVAANLAVSAFRRRLAEAGALLRLAARREPDPPLQPEAVDFWRAVRSPPARARRSPSTTWRAGRRPRSPASSAAARPPSAAICTAAAPPWPTASARAGRRTHERRHPRPRRR